MIPISVLVLQYRRLILLLHRLGNQSVKRKMQSPFTHELHS